MVNKAVLDTQDLVRQLTKVEDNGTPFLTVYLDTGFQSRHQEKGTLRLFLKHLRMTLERYDQELPDNARGLSMLDRLESALEALSPTAQGWAVFIREADEYFKTFESTLPFKNQWSLDEKPLLQPLLQQLENNEAFLAVFIDSRSAKIYEITLNNMIQEQQVESDVPGWHKQGGWSQLKYQHHIQDHKERHYERVSERVVGMTDTGLYKNIILLGEAENISALTRHLPVRIRRFIADSLPMAKYESPQRMLPRLKGLMEQFEEKQTQEALEGVLNQALAEGFATIGVEETLRAIQLGQVDCLYILEALDLEGWRCPQCGLFGSQGPTPKTECPYCGAPIQTASLAEELVLAVKRQDGAVDFVRQHPNLAQAGGVAALLRFKVEATF